MQSAFKPLIALLFSSVAFARAADSVSGAAMNTKHKALLQDFCVKCHGSEKQKGKFRVDDLPFTITDIETAEKWQKVLNQMNSGEMPPEDEKQPPNAAKTDLLDDLANVMVAARRSLSDQNGVITMRRLNRREYKNTLRELLGVEINVSELTGDTGAGGFDTMGSNLFMSGNQFEQYRALGREALEEAFEWQAAAGEEEKFRVEMEDTLKVITKNCDDLLDAQQRAERWVQAVNAAANQPENAAIVAALRKESKDEAVFRRSWARIIGAPAPEEFGFKTVENNADKANGALSYATKAGAGYHKPYYAYYLAQPHLDTGAYLTISGSLTLPNDNLTLDLPPKWPVGDYVVRIRVAATDNAPPDRRFFEFGIQPRNGQVMSTHQVTGTFDKPQVIEIPLTITRAHKDAGNRRLFVREKGNDHFTQTRAKFSAGKAKTGIGPEVAVWVDWMEIERVPNSVKPKPPGIAALDIALDDKASPPAPEKLRAVLSDFAKAAFRGATPTDGYLDRLLGIYDTRRQAGDKHSAALKGMLSLVLSSPRFLYLAEPATDEKRRPLTPQELATRLSYFLWGAPPDATLQNLAQHGELAKPAVLAAQTTRLLDDPRSVDFIEPFVYQWLGMDRLDFFEINRKLHPRFDNSVKLAARNEVFETFAFLLRKNASLRELLKSDHVVINSVLADYYRIDGVTGDAFQSVALLKNSPRGGLLGMAAVQLMGGNGERSNPVERGAWVLRKLLNDPPPPAPANVPQIARLAGKVLTTRERLQAHQEAAQCAGCHRKIDPIGFGLENFDAVGAWRTADSYQVMDDTGKPVQGASKTWQIDASATLHKGPQFADYFALRDIIANKSDAFAKGFSTVLIEYALGRPAGFRDEPLIAAMLQRADKKDLAMREFIHALVGSGEFQTK